MKKERIVVLSLCILISGCLHARWIAWAWQHALNSPTRAGWSARNGAQTGAAPGLPRFSVPSNFATALACAAWPPLGILYSEALIVGRNLEALPDYGQKSGENRAETLRYTGLGR